MINPFKTPEIVRLHKQDALGHTFCTGGTVAQRKAFDYALIHSQMRQGGGVIYVDTTPNEQGFDHFYKLACLESRALDVRMVDIEDAENSHTYNPLLCGDAETVSRRVMSVLNLLEEGVEKKDQILKGVRIIVAACVEAGFCVSFKTMQAYTSVASELENLYAQLPVDAVSTRVLKTFIDTISGDSMHLEDGHLLAYFGASAEYFSYFVEEDAGKVLNALVSEVDLDEVLEENQLVYVSLPYAKEDDVHKLIGKMLIGGVCTHIRLRQESSNPLNPFFLCVLDEFDTYTAPWFFNAIEYAKEVNLGFVLQSTSACELCTKGENTCVLSVKCGENITLKMPEDTVRFIAENPVQGKEIATWGLVSFNTPK